MRHAEMVAGAALAPVAAPEDRADIEARLAAVREHRLE